MGYLHRQLLVASGYVTNNKKGIITKQLDRRKSADLKKEQLRTNMKIYLHEKPERI